jgi:hypothetical protein
MQPPRRGARFWCSDHVAIGCSLQGRCSGPEVLVVAGCVYSLTIGIFAWNDDSEAQLLGVALPPVVGISSLVEIRREGGKGLVGDMVYWELCGRRFSP